jgi:hypothetical protein
VVVKGTPGAGVPATPANHYKLAEVEVVNGETEIENSMITDTREQVTVDERFVSFTGLELTESTKTDINGIVGGDGANLQEITLDNTLAIALGVLGVDLDEIGITEINTILSSLWLPRSETWTRLGNHSFSVSGDQTAIFRKGTKIRYKDGGGYEYGVVINSSYSSPNTTVTLATNTNYAMAAATITDKYISYGENPEGYPDWFDYSATLTAPGGTPPTYTATDIAKFRISGRLVDFYFEKSNSSGGTAGAGSVTLFVAMPVTPFTSGWLFGNFLLQNGGSGGIGLLRFGGGTVAYFMRHDFVNYNAVDQNNATRIINGRGSYIY